MYGIFSNRQLNSCEIACTANQPHQGLFESIGGWNLVFARKIHAEIFGNL